jgi:hypothetical protein
VPEPVGDGYQQPVAGPVAVHVVDHLEAVQVDEQHDQPVPAPAVTQQRCEVLEQPGPVDHAGERVVRRLVRPLALGPLQGGGRRSRREHRGSGRGQHLQQRDDPRQRGVRVLVHQHQDALPAALGHQREHHQRADPSGAQRPGGLEAVALLDAVGPARRRPGDVLDQLLAVGRGQVQQQRRERTLGRGRPPAPIAEQQRGTAHPGHGQCGVQGVQDQVLPVGDGRQLVAEPGEQRGGLLDRYAAELVGHRLEEGGQLLHPGDVVVVDRASGLDVEGTGHPASRSGTQISATTAGTARM